MKHWTRPVYSSRGAQRTRDEIYEGVLARSCNVCGKTLERKTRANGHMEDMAKFLRRKTCGRELIKGVYQHSLCLKKLNEDAGNPNYKGIMPKCKDCGKRLKTYPEKNGHQKGERCIDCQHKSQVGKHPEHLKRFAFKKGELHGIQFKKGCTPLNKKHDFCTISDCQGKHLAKGLCSKHYQRKYR